MLCSFIWFFIFSTISQQSIKFRIFEEPVCPLIFDICCRQQPNSVRMTFPHLLFFFLVVEAFWCDIPHLLYLAVCCSKGEEERLPFHCIFFLIVYLLKDSTFQIKPLLYHWYKSIIFSVYFFKQSFYFIYEFIDSLRISYNAFLSYLYSSLPPALSRSPPFPTHPISCSLYIFSGIKSN